MWGNRYFSRVGSKFTEGVVQIKKGEICLAFLECLFYKYKTLTGEKYVGKQVLFMGWLQVYWERDVNKTDHQGADT